MHMLVANWLSDAFSDGYSDAKFNAFESQPWHLALLMKLEKSKWEILILTVEQLWRNGKRRSGRKSSSRTLLK